MRFSANGVAIGRGRRSPAHPTGGLTMRHVRALLALFIACTLLISGFPVSTAFPVAAQDEGAAVPVTDEEGARYVAVNVAFDADAGNRFDITPYEIVLQDDAGFLWNQASMVLAEDALIPELSSQTLGPGSRVTGVVGFVVPEGRTPARVLYQPESSRLIPLLNLTGEEPPALGE